jgi:hypothetical protein
MTKLPTNRPVTIDDVTPLTVYDAVPPTSTARLRLKWAEATAKATRLDRINAALWQRDEDGRVERAEAERERRRRGR